MVYLILSIALFVLLGGAFFVLIHNNLIAKRNRVAQAYGSLEIYLKKRYDLIPNLVATVNKYTSHEKELLAEVVRLRESLLKEEDSGDKVHSENQLTDVLRKVQIQVENYPEIKADKQFMHLQWTLSDLEDQLSAARRAFNAAVVDYNNTIEMFPHSSVAGLKGFKAKALLHIPEKEQQYVEVASLFKD